MGETKSVRKTIKVRGKQYYALFINYYVCPGGDWFGREIYHASKRISRHYPSKAKARASDDGYDGKEIIGKKIRGIPRRSFK